MRNDDGQLTARSGPRPVCSKADYQMAQSSLVPHSVKGTVIDLGGPGTPAGALDTTGNFRVAAALAETMPPSELMGEFLSEDVSLSHVPGLFVRAAPEEYPGQQIARIYFAVRVTP